MNYINKETNEVKSYTQLRIENSSTSIPKDGTSTIMGVWKAITPTDKPVYDEYTEGVREIAPVNFIQKWEVYALPQAEIDANAITKLEHETRAWKSSREELVSNIEVVYGGVVYQGDEKSQDRMSRSINALPDDTSIIPWTAKDNTPHNLTRVDLREILLDAGSQQSAIWNTGRPVIAV